MQDAYQLVWKLCKSHWHLYTCMPLKQSWLKHWHRIHIQHVDTTFTLVYSRTIHVMFLINVYVHTYYTHYACPHAPAYTSDPTCSNVLFCAYIIKLYIKYDTHERCVQLCSLYTELDNMIHVQCVVWQWSLQSVHAWDCKKKEFICTIYSIIGCINSKDIHNSIIYYLQFHCTLVYEAWFKKPCPRAAVLLSGRCTHSWVDLLLRVPALVLQKATSVGMEHTNTCTYTHAHVHTHLYTYTQTHAHLHICTHTHMYVHTCTHTHNTHTHTHAQAAHLTTQQMPPRPAPIMASTMTREVSPTASGMYWAAAGRGEGGGGGGGGGGGMAEGKGEKTSAAASSSSANDEGSMYASLLDNLRVSPATDGQRPQLHPSS